MSNGWGRDQARSSVRLDLSHQQPTMKFATGKQRDKQPMIERLNLQNERAHDRNLVKSAYFLFLIWNICCGYSKEPSQ